MEAKDAPGCLMPNGSVLCAAGPAGEGGNFPGPTQFFEFDGASLYSVPNPPNSGGPPSSGRMLLIPSGQVLFADGSNQIFAYTPLADLILPGRRTSLPARTGSKPGTATPCMAGNSTDCPRP